MSVLILDNFVDTAGTALESHTISPTNTPATVWTPRLGTSLIGSPNGIGGANRAQRNTGGTLPSDPLGFGANSITTYSADSGASNCTITLNIGQQGCGLLARWVDTNNFLYTVNFSGTQYLVEVVAGVSTTNNVATANDGTAALVLNGASAQWGSSAGLEGSITLSSPTAGTKHGIFMFSESNGVDDFEVDGTAVTTGVSAPGRAAIIGGKAVLVGGSPAILVGFGIADWKKTMPRMKLGRRRNKKCA